MRIHYMDSLIILKIAGASIGSSIIVVFRPGGDSDWKLFQRFVIGLVVGVIAGPVVHDLLNFPSGAEYIIASAGLCGLVAVFGLQILLSKDIADAIKEYRSK